eukprot:COSAG02_NODE_588_length_19902_cov_115.928900_6_plen_40_part_00
MAEAVVVAAPVQATAVPVQGQAVPVAAVSAVAVSAGARP